MNQKRKTNQPKTEEKTLTLFVGDLGRNGCGQAPGGRRRPPAVRTTADLLSSVQLETVHAGEVDAAAHPDRLSGGAEGVGHCRAGAGGLPLWTTQNRPKVFTLISEQTLSPPYVFKLFYY